MRGTNEEWLKRDEAALASVLPRCSDVVALRGKGSWLIDVEQKRYLDFTSGIAACSTGHCHPKVVEAIQHQASMLIHTSVTVHQTVNIRLAERIGKLCPFFEEPQVFFTNSGAEAVDGSLKLARRVTGRSGVVAFQGAFHGRTVAATSLTTAKKKYRDGYSPFLPYVYNVPYGEEGSVEESLRRLDEALEGGSPKYPYPTGAIIVEPILGEGGYICPPRDWLQALRDRCDGINRLLIFDEVQTGIGRTGYPFAAETFGVKPDVILFAKGIASGMPLGGIISESRLLDLWPEGTHGSTFGGNPVSCAAGLATLDVIDNYCLANVRRNSEKALKQLAPWHASGVGYMIRIPLSNKITAQRVQQLCLERGLLILLCGPDENIIRLIPPLTVSNAEWEIALGILENSLIDGILMYSC